MNPTITSNAAGHAIERPPAPDCIEDLGIAPSTVNDLILRYLWLHGSGTLGALHRILKLSFPILETVFHQFRTQHLIEVKGMVGEDYAFTLSGPGRTLAASRSEVCHYVGPAPVSLEQYTQVVRAQAAKLTLNRETLREAFRDLVLPDSLLDSLGPALIGHQSLFLYGGTGNGKTSIAERIPRVYRDRVAVPYAVEVDGHIITMFDPAVHHAEARANEALDPRWVICDRPCISVGGELSAGMLELQRDEATGVFIAPCQLKANNGVLVIDDFGRQVLSPRELLNRWIIPLDRGVDYLTLASGLKFQTPFEVMVVFSSNLNPQNLADEAFLRRIRTKVMVDNITPEVFDSIFDRVVAANRVEAEPGAARFLRERCAAAGAAKLRACYPKDIFLLVKAISEYEGRPVRLSGADLDRAVNLYFARTSLPGE
ncbi:MAG TPA: hypothetical protein VMU19_06410 [Bryobacteraceae bacterium]|nr:hypothetical protein [Bryobacteraceae bacterium]